MRIKNSSEPLYPLRDKIALQLNEEIIENVLYSVMQQHFPASEKEILPKKLAGYVKSTVAVLFKAIPAKRQTMWLNSQLSFQRKAYLKIRKGQYKVGVACDAGLVTNLKYNFAELLKRVMTLIKVPQQNYK